MSEFIIRTADSVYTYDVSDSTEAKSADISFTYEANLQESDTQGFLVKHQKGKYRIVANVAMVDSKARFEQYLLPQWQYPSYLVATFDRNLPAKSVAYGNFLMRDYKIAREFGGGIYEVEITLVEVLNT